LFVRFYNKIHFAYLLLLLLLLLLLFKRVKTWLFKNYCSLYRYRLLLSLRLLDAIVIISRMNICNEFIPCRPAARNNSFSIFGIVRYTQTQYFFFIWFPYQPFN